MSDQNAFIRTLGGGDKNKSVPGFPESRNTKLPSDEQLKESGFRNRKGLQQSVLEKNPQTTQTGICKTSLDN